MKHNLVLLTLTLAAATTFAAAQMMPGGMQRPAGMGQPGMGQQPTMGQQMPGQMPGIGQPGMSNGNNMPGMGQQQQQTSTETKVNDEVLQSQVHQQLAGHNGFNNVQVIANNGVITLEGTVPSKQDKKEAKKLAKSVAGVRRVKEQLRISPGSPSASSATPVSTLGERPIAASSTCPCNATGAGARGTNPASGQPGSAASGATTATTATCDCSAPESAAAAAIGANANALSQSGNQAGMAPAVGSNAAQQSGQAATGITREETNEGAAAGQLSTRPAAELPNPGTPNYQIPAAESPSEISGQVQTTISNQVPGSNVSVNVTDNNTNIVLSGTVQNDKDRQTATRIAKSFANGRKVVDHLTVSGSSNANTNGMTPESSNSMSGQSTTSPVGTSTSNQEPTTPPRQ